MGNCSSGKSGTVTYFRNALLAYSCGRLGYQEVQFDILEARSVPQMLLKADEIPAPLRCDT